MVGTAQNNSFTVPLTDRNAEGYFATGFSFQI